MEEKGKYHLQKVLGSGSFGYVFLAVNKQTNEVSAIKRIQKIGNQLSREYEILLELKNTKHCVQLRDCFFTKNESKRLVQNLVFEYVNNDLERLIEKTKSQKKKLDAIQVKDIGYQLFKGLEEMHGRSIMHRDLKPENVLLSSEGVVKICDFGSSKFIDKSQKNTPYIVSRYYRAPELYFCSTDYDGAIDVWAAGCILAELVTLAPFFKGNSDDEQPFAIFKLWGGLNDSQRKLYASMVPNLKASIQKMPSFPRNYAAIHELFAGFEGADLLVDLLEKVFDFTPENRFTAKQVLAHPFFAGQATRYRAFMKKVGC